MKRLLNILRRGALALAGILMMLTGLGYAVYVVYITPDVTHDDILQFYFLMGGFAGAALALALGGWLVGKAVED